VPAREPLALGGVAGAAAVRRAVDPVNLLVWIDGREVTALERTLVGLPAQPGRGTVTVVAAPDPWTLLLAEDRGVLPIADPVQLWLDCSSEGERALEAAHAVAEEMGW